MKPVINKVLIAAFSALFVLVSTSTYAIGFDTGQNVFNFGIGYGNNYGYEGYNYSNNGFQVPGVSVSYDHGFIYNKNGGVVGIGIIYGYQEVYHNYVPAVYGGNYREYWQDNIGAVRISYHFNFFTNSRIDTYAGLLGGVRIERYHDNFYDKNHFYLDSNYPDYTTPFPAIGLYLGTRYNFTKKFGVFAELCYGLNYLTGGIDVKF